MTLGASLFLLFALALPGQAQAAAISSNATGNWNTAGTWVGGVVPGAADDVTIVAGHTVTMDTGTGVISINSLAVNGVLNHTANTTTESFKINLSVAGDVTINSGGAIDVTGKGYATGNNGPGGGGTSQAGTHGGVGGSTLVADAATRTNPKATYDSLTNPVNLGSGGNNSAGGGAIIISTTGTVTVTGTVAADGVTALNNCGSGGTVSITAGTLAGAGTIRANGGTPTNAGYSGGGGGRIAVSATTDTFSGTIQANGGASNYKGFAGTIYLTASKRNTLTLGGAGNMASLRLGSDGTNNYTFTTITIQTGGTLEIDSNPNMNTSQGGAATLTVTTLDIQSGGVLKADGLGFSNSAGPGGSSGNNQGGTYGGVGASTGAADAATRANPKATYGSFTNPIYLGSGGNTNSAGGALILSVSGTLTVNGTLSANGAGTSACGSGGSVNLTAGTLAGAGTIRANGGLSLPGNASGGGGGRIAVSATTDTFSGAIQANGGLGDYKGFAGTVYLSASKRDTLTLGGAGNMSTLRLGSDGTNNYTFTTITIQTGGTLEIDGNPNMNTNQGGAATLNVTTLDIQSGGVLKADALGFSNSAGPGGGVLTNESGTYGGVGGSQGAAVAATRANPKATYGSFTNPVNLGSGGTTSAAGGAVILSVSGTLTVNGTLSANGAGTSIFGSGGSVNLTAGTLAGSGTIRANGGGLSGNAVGAGGGRIAISATTDTFSGTIQANGGLGSWKGCAGTVYLSASKRNSLTLGGAGNLASLRLGSDGTNNYTFTTITIQSGGTLEIDGNPNMNSNNGGAATLTVTTLDVQSGGVLSANGFGFGEVAGGPGDGGGVSNRAATYGGVGGSGVAADAATKANSKATYGSFTNPINLGSSSGVGSLAGGAGGGAILLVASGTVTVNGTLSANGLAGYSNGAAGSGGSVNITAGTLTGTGAIQANGGPSASGSSTYVGGGGGGRIAISDTTDTFAGTVTAKGGGSNYGYPGFAGTVYLPASKRANLVLGGAGNMTSLRLGSDGTNNYTFTTITIQSGGTLEIDGNPNMNTNQGGAATLNVTTLDIQSGGVLKADALGFAIAAGPGGGGTSQAGTYGGVGGSGAAADAATKANPDATYGSFTNPVNLGSGGIATAGGGAVILSVSGTLTVNGIASADGGTDGSGGSVNLTAGTLAGSGTIRASGGVSFSGPSVTGGGGRIAISATTDTFSGTIQALGGTALVAPPTNPGFAGTVYLSASKRANLIVGGAGNIGILQFGFDGTNNYTFGPVKVNSGGTLTMGTNPNTAGGSVTVTTVDISTGSTFTAPTLNLGSGATGSASVNTVTLSAANQALVGVNSFANLRMRVSSSFFLTLPSGAITTVRGFLDLSGAPGNPIAIRSSVPGTPAKLNLLAGGTQSLLNLDIKDSDASGGLLLIAYDSIDSGGNTNWTFSALDLSAGLVGYWKLDNNALDSASTNNGTVVGGVTYSTTIPSTAVPPTNTHSGSFDGVNGRIDTTAAVDDTITNAFTLSAWINTASVAAGAREIIRNDAGSGTRGFFLRQNAAIIQGYVYNGAVRTAAGTTTLSINTWYHVATVYDGATLKVYVNGTQDGTLSTSGNMTLSATAAVIGSYSAGEYFNGKIDDVRVYNRALSTTELVRLAQGGAGTGVLTLKDSVSASTTLTKSTSVTTAFTVLETGASAYVLSNTAGSFGATSAIGSTPSFTPAGAWAMNGGADGERIVYARITKLDASTYVVSDSITLDATPPAVPTGLTLTANSDNTAITATATAPSISDVSNLIFRYTAVDGNVAPSYPASSTTGTAFGAGLVSAVTPSSSQTIIASALTQLKTYGVSCWAQDNAGNVSATAAQAYLYLAPPSARLVVTASGISALAGSTQTLTITAVDANGATTPSYGGPYTLTWTPAGGSAVTLVSSSSAGWSSGVTTASVTIGGSDAGIGTFTAIDNSSTALTNGTLAFTYYPSSFTVTTSATALTAGKVFTLTATAKDTAGATVTRYAGTVALSLSATPTATKLLSAASMVATAGIATASVSYPDCASVVTITCKDTTYVSGVTIQGTSPSLSFIPDKFTVTAGSPPPRRTVWYLNESVNPVTVKALEAGGTIAPNYRGTIKFAATTTSGLSLPSDYAFTAGDAGKHDFTGIIATAAGTYTVSVSDSANAGVVGASGSFGVVDAKVLVSTVSGAVGTLSVPVRIVDAIGNIIPDDTTLMTVTLTEEKADGSASVSPSSVRFTYGQANLSVTDSAGEKVTVGGSTNPTLPVTSAIVTFGSSSSTYTTSFTYITFETAPGSYAIAPIYSYPTGTYYTSPTSTYTAPTGTYYTSPTTSTVSPLGNTTFSQLSQANTFTQAGRYDTGTYSGLTSLQGSYAPAGFGNPAGAYSPTATTAYSGFTGFTAPAGTNGSSGQGGYFGPAAYGSFTGTSSAGHTNAFSPGAFEAGTAGLPPAIAASMQSYFNARQSGSFSGGDFSAGGGPAASAWGGPASGGGWGGWAPASGGGKTSGSGSFNATSPFGGAAMGSFGGWGPSGGNAGSFSGTPGSSGGNAGSFSGTPGSSGGWGPSSGNVGNFSGTPGSFSGGWAPSGGNAGSFSGTPGSSGGWGPSSGNAGGSFGGWSPDASGSAAGGMPAWMSAPANFGGQGSPGGSSTMPGGFGEDFSGPGSFGAGGFNSGGGEGEKKGEGESSQGSASGGSTTTSTTGASSDSGVTE